MTRFSDGQTYKGYAISDDGSHIILPKAAVDDGHACNNLRARGFDTEGMTRARWKAAIERDLNIPGLWEKYHPHYNLNGAGDHVLTKGPAREPVTVEQLCLAFPEIIDWLQMEELVFRTERKHGNAAFAGKIVALFQAFLADRPK